MPKPGDAEIKQFAKKKKIFAELVANFESEEVREKPSIDEIYTEDERKLLDAKLRAFHAANPDIVKIPRIKDQNFDRSIERKLAQAGITWQDLQYSIIFDTDGNPFMLYAGKEKKLGEGGFGKVKFIQDLASGDWFAVKIVKEKLAAEGIELQVNKKLQRLKSIFTRTSAQGDAKTYIVQTAFLGPHPFSNILTHINQPDFKAIALQKWIATSIVMLQKLNELHAMGIIHRDLKSDNFKQTDATLASMNILDFELSAYIDNETGILQGPRGVGNMEAQPPETTRFHKLTEALETSPAIYSKASDIYGLAKAFEHALDQIEIIFAALQFGDPIINATLAECRETLAKFLQDKPESRPTGEEAIKLLEHLAHKIAMLPGEITAAEEIFAGLVNGTLGDDAIYATINKNPQLLQNVTVDGLNIIHLAILMDRFDLAEKLLALPNINMEVKTKLGTSYFDLAVAKQQFRLASILTENSSTALRKPREHELFYIAAANGLEDQLQIIFAKNKEILDVPDANQMTALRYAIDNDHINAVQQLVQLGADMFACVKPFVWDQNDTYKANFPDIFNACIKHQRLDLLSNAIQLLEEQIYNPNVMEQIQTNLNEAGIKLQTMQNRG